MPNHSRDTLATGTLTSISQCHFAWLQRYTLLVHTHKASLIRTLCWEVGSKSSSLKSRLCRGQPSPRETRALILHTDDTLCPPEKNPCYAILPNFGQGSNSHPPSPNCDSQGYRFVSQHFLPLDPAVKICQGGMALLYISLGKESLLPDFCIS